MTDLRTLLTATCLFLIVAASFIGGMIAAIEKGIERCPSWHLRQGDQTVLLLSAPAGSDGVQCITVRGYFEGEPSQWRYLSPLQ